MQRAATGHRRSSWSEVCSPTPSPWRRCSRPSTTSAGRPAPGSRSWVSFTEGLADSGEVVARIEGTFTRDGGYEAMAELLARGARPDVVFAVNDVMAVGALAAAREAGVSVPGDIRVAGFDDIPTLRDIVPSLTTVRVPLERIGEVAVRMALGEVTTEPPEASEYEVVLRESTS